MNHVLDSRALPRLPERRVSLPRRRTRANLEAIALATGLTLTDLNEPTREESVHAQIDFAAMSPTLLGDLDPNSRMDVIRQTKQECNTRDKFSWVELRFVKDYPVRIMTGTSQDCGG